MAGMVLIRVFLGAFFLYAVSSKVVDPTRFVHALHDMTIARGDFVLGNNFPIAAHFLTHTVAPHAELFAWLVIAGEAIVGILLVIGLLTRAAALAGLAMNIPYLLATMHLGAANMGVNAGFIAMELAVLIAAAGRTWGIDSVLAKRTRVKLFW